ncbi:MAG: DUF1398 domain-containing protein [Bacteroidales bacterium]
MTFTVAQIKAAHAKVKSGADFPQYIRDIRALGVEAFETRVKDSQTVYFGSNGFDSASEPMYDELTIADNTRSVEFVSRLKAHQRGETDYFTFCRDCAESGIEKWVVNLEALTCIYFDKAGNEILTEQIPQ